MDSSPNLTERDRSSDAPHFDWTSIKCIGPNDRYVVLGLIEDGTFGRVVEARDTSTGTKVAIKVIRAVARYIDAAKKEAEIIRSLNCNDP